MGTPVSRKHPAHFSVLYTTPGRGRGRAAGSWGTYVTSQGANSLTHKMGEVPGHPRCANMKCPGTLPRRCSGDPRQKGSKAVCINRDKSCRAKGTHSTTPDPNRCTTKSPPQGRSSVPSHQTCSHRRPVCVTKRALRLSGSHTQLCRFRVPGVLCFQTSPAAQRAQGDGRGLASLCSHVSPVSMCPPGCCMTGMHNVM